MHTLQRDPLLDIFRGFAIFGIFFINITIMHCLFINQDSFATQFQDATSDLINRVLQLFFYNKFFPIFSFLFGLGITLQILKSKTISHYKSQNAMHMIKIVGRTLEGLSSLIQTLISTF